MLLFPAAPSQIPSSGIWALALSPLPDRNGRKFVGDWGGTTHVSFRIGGMLLVNSCTILYTSAEIPPAGAPSGFDSAAILHFIACFSISVPLRSE